MGARLAAGYAWALLKNRPFAEGNTRLALAAMLTCLEMNRLAWKCSEVEETAMLLHAAAGKMKEAEWEAWVVGEGGVPISHLRKPRLRSSLPLFMPCDTAASIRDTRRGFSAWVFRKDAGRQ